MDYLSSIPRDAPRLLIRVIEGGSVNPGGGNFELIISGEMAQKFSESYRYQMNVTKGSLNPHPVNFLWSEGQFEDYEFSVTLFSGCFFNGRILNSGSEIMQAALGLSNLSKPVWNGSRFNASPLCRVAIQGSKYRWWSAQGFFNSSTVTFKGAYDESGMPTVVDVDLGFVRHFGRYDRMAVPQSDLATKVVCNAYKFTIQ